MALVVKNFLANAGDLRDMGSIPGWKDPLEEGMATHSSILSWRIHGQRSPPTGSQRVGLKQLSTAQHTR